LACFGRWSAYPDVVIDIAAIRARFEALEPVLDERGRRLFAASEARAAGHGGVVAVSQATGIARSLIDRGLADLRSGAVMFSPRVRRQGGGGKPATETQPGLLETSNSIGTVWAFRPEALWGRDSSTAPSPSSICRRG
jgi:hypothetical protein